MLSTFQSYLFYSRDPVQSLRRTAAEGTASRAESYYNANIGKVKSVDDFLNNYQLFSYAMNAYGLSDMTYAKAFMKKVLTSDLSDQSSFVNKLSDSRYKAFAQAFNFNKSGAITSSATAQSSTQAADLATRYTQAAGSASTIASTEATYMQSAVASAATVGDVTGNARLMADLVKAYGLNAYTSKDAIAAAIESDASDPSSYVNGSGQQAGLKQLATDLHAGSDGTLVGQSSTQAIDMASRYTTAAAAATPPASSEVTYMQKAIAGLNSVSDLTGNSRLLSDVLSAYGLDPSTSIATVTSALESDTSDPSSFVNRAGQDAGLKAMAEDFNFSATGAVTTQRVAQSVASGTAMATAYAAQAGTNAASKAAAKSETTYVAGVIANATSVADLANDPRVVTYIGKAFGVPTLTAAQLKSTLTSDPSNLKSAAYTLGTAGAAIAAAFNFTSKGLIAAPVDGVAQGKAQLSATNLGYLQQTEETEAGQDNTGTQLALYFARKAPTITNAYQILADPALLKVARTLLNLPSSTTTDIDILAKQITSGIKLADLQNPTKVNALVSRFAALYDLANPSTTGQDDVSLLFGGSDSSSSSSSSTSGITSLLG